MATREEEYLRRMKALGYEPSLAGMDDDDIEWELSKMEEADRRREAQLQQPLRTVYRPVDPGLKARILRQFGQPYDESAIDPRESFYLNGWDNGEDDGDVETWQGKASPGVSAPYQGSRRKSHINDPDFDPWKNAWHLDWGPEGSSPAQLRTMEYRPGRDGTYFPKRMVVDSMGFGLGGADALSGVQPMSEVVKAGEFEDSNNSDISVSNDIAGSEVKAAGGEKLWPYANPIVEITVGATDLAKEVEKESLAQGDSPELAKKKAEDSMGRYYVWQAAVLASTRAAGSKWGDKGAAIAGVGGTLASHLGVKEMIKKQVLGNTEHDYNTLFPGNMPPGPG